MKCFYHGSDLDGICSAAIVHKKYPKCEMFAVDYNDKLIKYLNTIRQDEIVFVVDFSFYPFEDMLELKKYCKQLIWIDHHKTALEDASRYAFDSCDGLRKIDKAACELIWEYFYEKQTLPLAVRLLGRYDVWDFSDERTLAFQYGMRNRNTYPEDLCWNTLLSNNITVAEKIIQHGNIILKFALVDEGEFFMGNFKQELLYNKI